FAAFIRKTDIQYLVRGVERIDGCGELSGERNLTAEVDADLIVDDRRQKGQVIAGAADRVRADVDTVGIVGDPAADIASFPGAFAAFRPIFGHKKNLSKKSLLYFMPGKSFCSANSIYIRGS